jgi:hypothetical protein
MSSCRSVESEELEERRDDDANAVDLDSESDLVPGPTTGGRKRQRTSNNGTTRSGRHHASLAC